MNIFDFQGRRGFLAALLLLLLMCNVGAFAQSTQRNFVVDSRHGESAPLRDLPTVMESPVMRIDHPVRPLPPLRQGQFRATSVQPESPLVATTSATPTIGLNFLGLGNGFTGFTITGAPPDTDGAVGATQYVQYVNGGFEVFDKNTGASVAGPTKESSLFSTLGGDCALTDDGDPVVLYDKVANRWILSEFSVTGPGDDECVAVSKTSDATGAYNVYDFTYTNFNDYPKIGIFGSTYYATFNMFDNTTSAFVGGQMCAYDRTNMLAGSAAKQECSPLDVFHGGILPADADGFTPPPSSEKGFFLGMENTSSLALWSVSTIDFTTDTFTLAGPTILPVNSFLEACGGGTCIPQAGTSQRLDSLGDRLMFRLAYRNFGAHESLVANNSVTVGSTVGINWYEIRDPAGTPIVFQQGTFAPDSNFRWMGSMAMDGKGNIALGYSASSTSIRPQVRIATRGPNDPLNTLGNEIHVKDGAGSQIGTDSRGSLVTRWGDYSAMTVDPTDDCTMWYTDEFEPANGVFNWSTQIANFRMAGCTSTTTGVVSSLNPSPFGQSLTFTVIVTPSASGTPTGTVTLFDGGTNLGTMSLTSAQAAFPISTLTVGTHSITAVYSGDSNFNPSASSIVTQTVNKAGTATALTSSLNPSSFGQAVTFKATVTPQFGSVTPTGAITFKDGSSVLGTVTLSSGVATFSTASLTVATHSITAAYGGDSNYVSSSSTAVSQVVNPGGSTADLALILNHAPDPAHYGGRLPLVFTATVTNSGPSTPTAITFDLNLSGNALIRSAVSTQNTCQINANSVHCAVGSLGTSNVNNTATITITVTPLLGHTLNAQAIVGSEFSDTTPGDNVSNAAVRIRLLPMNH